MIYAYAAKANFAGKKEYPFATKVFSSVIDDINSNINGRITISVQRSIVKLAKI
jgi:hypothetical protein